MSLVTETTYTRPETVTAEVWEKLNKNQQRQANESANANGFRVELEKTLIELAALSPEERAERLTLKVNALSSEQNKRRYWHSFLIGSEKVLPKNQTNGTKFKEAFDAYVAENFEKGEVKSAVTDEDGNTVIFDDLPMPEPTEPKAKENELTAYLKDAELSRAEYNETLSTLSKSDLENVFSLMIGILNYAFVSLSIMFPEKENQLPKSAREFILHLISVKPADTTEFQMLDAELMAKCGIKSKTTLIGMRNALINWQSLPLNGYDENGNPKGIGLIEINKKANANGDPSQSKGIKYNLLILDIVASKALSFIENGVSVADAQVAVSAITRGDEAQIKLLPQNVREAAENIIEETRFDVETLPTVNTEVTEAAAALKATAEKTKAEKAEQEEKKAADRTEKIGDALNAINDYRKATPEERDEELFTNFVWGRLVETRHDQTNSLTVDEAKGKLETVLNRIESDIITATALIERLPTDEQRAQSNYLTRMAQNITKAAKDA